MTINVRQATNEDVQALAGLNASVQELHVAHQPDYFKRPESLPTADWFCSMLRSPGTRIWVAELDGFPAGYALTIDHDRPENAFCFARRFCEIDQIAAAPGFRRRGLARALIECVLEDARFRGFPEVELSSWCFNADAHNAFRALGFSPKTTRFARKSS